MPYGPKSSNLSLLVIVHLNRSMESSLGNVFVAKSRNTFNFFKFTTKGPFAKAIVVEPPEHEWF